MLIFAWLFLIIYSSFALYDYKKAIIAWVPLRLLFNPQIAIKYSIPAISLDLAVSVVLIIIFFSHYWRLSNRKILNNSVFLLKYVMLAIFISYVLSIAFSSVPLGRGINTTIKFFTLNCFLLYAFQRCLKSKKDMSYLIRITLFVVVLMTSLSVYEFIMRDNPILDFVYYNTPHDDALGNRMSYIPPSLGGNRLRFGFVRTYSFFQMSLAYGATCVFMLFLIGTLLKGIYIKIDRRILSLCVVLLVFGVFASNSKQIYIGIIIMLFCFVKTKYILSYRLMIAAVVFVFLFYYFPELMNNYFSLFDEKLAEEGGGSSVGLRIRQYKVALNIFEENPLTGYGPGSLDYLKSFGNNWEIRGAESIWLRILPERGVIGGVAYLFMFFDLYNRLKSKIPRKELLLYLLTIFVIENLGGEKDMTLYMAILVIVMRLYELNRLEILKRKTNEIPQ